MGTSRVMGGLCAPSSMYLGTISNIFNRSVVLSSNGVSEPLLTGETFSDGRGARLLGSVIRPFIACRFVREIGRTRASNGDIIVCSTPRLFRDNTSIFYSLVMDIATGGRVVLREVYGESGVSVSHTRLEVSTRLSRGFFEDRDSVIVRGGFSVRRIRLTARGTTRTVGGLVE